MLSRLTNYLLRVFFYHFYHSLAWTYDAVAAIVSLGNWSDWIRSVVPFLQGPRVLELGYGSGHLQEEMLSRNLGLAVGLDESPQMAAIAAHRLRRSGYEWRNLTRGIAQQLPFSQGAFDTVVATFPPEFIFDPATLREVRRVLRTGGRAVIVPAAWIVGRGLLERGAAWLFRITGQVPPGPQAILENRLSVPLKRAGFIIESGTIQMGSSLVLIVVATVPAGPPESATGDAAPGD